MSQPEASANRSLLESLVSLREPERTRFLATLSDEQVRFLLYSWEASARPNQLMPGTSGAESQRKDWTLWLLLAGRGFGKTRTGAEAVKLWAAERRAAPIHLIAPTAADVRAVMVEGPAGLLACYRPDEANRPVYEPSRRQVTWPNGNIAKTFSADEPDRLRGPQCERFWFDEPAACKRRDDTWDNLMFGFRLGNPQGVITTTPRPVDLIRNLVKNPAAVVTRGTSYENRANLAPAFFDEIVRKYEGTRLGRQELLAEILEDREGALWRRGMIDQHRIDLADVPALVRVVVAIDPAVSANANSDETGIGAVGMDQRGHCYVFEDSSMKGSPLEWAREAIALAKRWSADRIVAEVNNGGDLVEANIRAVLPHAPFRAVRATRGKILRAEPAAALYEQGRVHHVGDPRRFVELEDQLCNYSAESSDKSPDRLDWLVWALFDLVIDPAEQRIQMIADTGYQISPI